MNRDKLKELAEKLASIAAIFVPGHAVAIRGVLEVVTELADGLQRVRDEDPALWAEIAADYNDAVAKLQASIAAAKPTE